MSGVGGVTGRFAAALRSAGRLARLALLPCLLLLAGCGRADLYSNLSEAEANQMLAVLMTSGISADKVNLGGSFTVRVDQDDMVRAISTLTSKGYPRNTRDSIGQIFQKSGLISSPFEERVRYIYALGEEVAQTLSQIDGVVTTRVHVVLPDQPQLGQPVKPSSAAVFIKHEPTVDLEFFVPQIRRLVSSAIEGLDYAAVTVILTEAAPMELVTADVGEQLTEVLPGLALREADAAYFWRIVYGVGAVLALLLVTSVAGGVALLLRRRRTARAAPGPDSQTVLEPS